MLAPLVTAAIDGPVPGAPACETETDTPAIEMMAERAPPALAATASVIVAGPVPTALPEYVIHYGGLWTAQAQDAEVWMVTAGFPFWREGPLA